METNEDIGFSTASAIDHKQDVLLVDTLSELYLRKKKIEEQIKELKDKLYVRARERRTDIFIGTKMRASVKEYMKIVHPEENRALLLETIKKKGLFETYASINYFKLNPRIMKNEIDPEIARLAKKELAFRISLKPL